MKEKENNLIANLQKASDYFKSLGETTDLYYNETAYDIGIMVEKLKSKIENETIGDNEIKELRLMPLNSAARVNKDFESLLTLKSMRSFRECVFVLIRKPKRINLMLQMW